MKLQCVKNTISRPKYKYKYISFDFFLANEERKKQLYLGWIFFGKYKFIWIPFLRPIQIQIYLGVPKLGQCEYKYDYSDWYLKIKIQIRIHSTQNKLYAYEYKCYKSMQINRHMCHNIWFIVLD